MAHNSNAIVDRDNGGNVINIRKEIEMKVKFFGIKMDIEWLVMWLISALGSLIDHFVAGEALSLKEKKIVRTVDYLGKEWGKYVADNTETEIDDAAIKEILEQAQDAADEGGFELVELPGLEA